MAKKRKFPGSLSAEQLEFIAMQKAAEQKEIEEAKKKEQKATKNLDARTIKYKKLIDKFAPRLSKSDIAWYMGLVFFINYLIGGLDRGISDFYIEPSDSISTTRMVGPNLKDAVREAYNPFFHGSIKKTIDGIDTERDAYVSNNINSRWSRHMVLLAMEAFILASALLFRMKRRHDAKEEIDLVLEIEYLAKRNKVTPEIIKQMMLIAPDILHHMSKESPVFFEMLMDGKMDYDKNHIVFTAARSVLEGHLESHPEDLKRVMAAFYKDSLPQSVLQLANQKQYN